MATYKMAINEITTKLEDLVVIIFKIKLLCIIQSVMKIFSDSPYGSNDIM